MKYKGKQFPKDLYMVRDAAGIVRWYEKDPMKTADRDDAEVDLTEVLEDFYGAGSVANPVALRLVGARLYRCEPFAISQPAAIRMGKLARHLEDLAGHVVDILDARNPDVEYPLNGVLMDRDGHMTGTATYSMKGECSDGNPDHALVCVEGAFLKDEKKEGKEQ